MPIAIYWSRSRGNVVGSACARVFASSLFGNMAHPNVFSFNLHGAMQMICLSIALRHEFFYLSNVGILASFSRLAAAPATAASVDANET